MLGWRSTQELTALDMLRRLRSDNSPLKLGGSRPKTFQYYLSLFAVFALFGVPAVVGYWLFNKPLGYGFLVAVSLCGLLVVPSLLVQESKQLIYDWKRSYARPFLESLAWLLFYVAIFVISAGFMAWCIAEYLPKTWQNKIVEGLLCLGWAGLGIVSQVWMKDYLAPVAGLPLAIKIPKNHRRRATSQPFILWLGQSSGELAENRHGVGLAPGCNINLSLADAAQNILVLGGIGSGKTTRAMHPLLMQLLDQDCGGLIFDVKGDFQGAVKQFAESTGRTVTTLGIGQQPFNLLAGLSPELAASFLKSAFLLGNTQRLDSFWVDTATELCRNALGVLSHFPELYSLQNLYQFLFIEKFREHIKAAAIRWLEEVDEKEAALLQSYLNYDKHIFSQFEAKVKSNVLATVAQVLAPFNHPKLVEAFCTASMKPKNEVRLESVLDGAVYLVDLPLAQWGLGAKVAYTLIKLRFFNVMQQRALQKDWNQERPVFFLCDEYQELISASNDGLSDLNFWDKSRSSKTIGIISAQSVSSFYAVLQNRDMTQALLQNFRQKLCFRTEDAATIQLFKELMGQVDVPKVTTGQAHGTSGWPFGQPHESSHTSTSWHKEAVLDAQTFRTLLHYQAVALLSINNYSWDDVVNMLGVYV